MKKRLLFYILLSAISSVPAIGSNMKHTKLTKAKSPENLYKIRVYNKKRPKRQENEMYKKLHLITI